MMTIDRKRSALVLVDIQPDFMPGGGLPVTDGHRILDGVRKLMDSDAFGLQVATQDWHPPDHVSFAANHPGKEPLEVISLHGHDQVLWPLHCVQGTEGAELHPELPWGQVSVIIRKGDDPRTDSYSGFRNNWNPDGLRPGTGLAGYLRERKVSDLYVCGLARDYCVKWTAEDAAAEGFRTRVIWDLTRSVDPSGDDDLRKTLASAGVELVESSELEMESPS